MPKPLVMIFSDTSDSSKTRVFGPLPGDLPNDSLVALAVRLCQSHETWHVADLRPLKRKVITSALPQGKTAIVREMAEKLGKPVTDMPLVMHDELPMCGVTGESPDTCQCANHVKQREVLGKAAASEFSAYNALTDSIFRRDQEFVRCDMCGYKLPADSPAATTPPAPRCFACRPFACRPVRAAENAQPVQPANVADELPGSSTPHDPLNCDACFSGAYVEVMRLMESRSLQKKPVVATRDLLLMFMQELRLSGADPRRHEWLHGRMEV